jgi:hypothetical protein
MGYGLAHLFSELGSTNILDYQIKYSQLGISGTSNYGVSTFKLASCVPFNQLSGTDLPVTQHSHYQNGSVVTDQPFIIIPAQNIQKASATSVRFNIVIPENALNITEPLNEIGLFMKNPTGQATTESVLVAYRYFTSLEKTNDFSILFRWTIHF